MSRQFKKFLEKNRNTSAYMKVVSRTELKIVKNFLSKKKLLVLVSIYVKYHTYIQDVCVQNDRQYIVYHFLIKYFREFS